MSIRLRTFAALLALLALAVSSAGQAWAEACTRMEASPEAAHALHHAADAPAPEHRSDPVPPDPAPCPMATAAGMVCGAVALPTGAPPALLGPGVRAPLAPAADEAPASLALSSLFRPPRG